MHTVYPVFTFPATTFGSVDLRTDSFIMFASGDTGLSKYLILIGCKMTIISWEWLPIKVVCLLF